MLCLQKQLKVTNKTMRSINFEVTEKFNDKPLLHFLKSEVKMSSRLIKTLKRVENGMQCNGEHIRTIDKVKTGDKITINMPDVEILVGTTDENLDVVYEDDDILIVNKPPTMPIHETRNNQGNTLMNAVLGYLSAKGKPTSFRAIGRLDRGTSGLVLCALNPYIAASLSGEIEKSYLAIASKKIEENGTINAPIYRPAPPKTHRCVDQRGDRAVTHYEVISSGENYSLLKINLETGRTHQIRVHFAHLDSPLYGDDMYGEKSGKLSHQALHCFEMNFTHPVSKQMIQVQGEMPKDMKKLLDELKSY